MKKNLTLLVLVVDKSGSMDKIKQGAIDGFNNFIKAQREMKGKAIATVCLFDDTYEFLADSISLKNIKLLSNENYHPNGSTALNDTLGMMIDKIGQQMVSTSEKDRPSKVIFCIVSDGEENASTKYTSTQVKLLVEQRKEQFGWEFVFIGTNQDITKTAKTYSFDTKSTFSFNNSSAGLTDGYATMTSYVSSVRGN
jgi:hypothetical protein